MSCGASGKRARRGNIMVNLRLPLRSRLSQKPVCAERYSPGYLFQVDEGVVRPEPRCWHRAFGLEHQTSKKTTPRTRSCSNARDRKAGFVPDMRCSATETGVPHNIAFGPTVPLSASRKRRRSHQSESDKTAGNVSQPAHLAIATVAQLVAMRELACALAVEPQIPAA